MKEAVIVKIDDLSKYESQHPRFAKAFEFLRRPDLAKLEPGKYPIDGDNVYASISDSTLKTAGEMQHPEFHRRYLDIQSPISGDEVMGLPSMPADESGFDEAKDIGFFDASCPLVTLKPGDVMLIPPRTAHAPCLTTGESHKIRKVVIKVLW